MLGDGSNGSIGTPKRAQRVGSWKSIGAQLLVGDSVIAGDQIFGVGEVPGRLRMQWLLAPWPSRSRSEKWRGRWQGELQKQCSPCLYPNQSSGGFDAVVHVDGGLLWQCPP